MDSPEGQYRAAWQTWTLTSDEDTKLVLEQLMDDLQPSIAAEGDPRWVEFLDSLPGHKIFWERFSTEEVGAKDSSELD